MCMCSDGPRAGLIKWVHAANVTLLGPSDTTPGCSFPLRVFVCLWGQALSLFYNKDVTFPCTVCERGRERRNHDSTTAEAHQWNSSASLKSLKWDLTHAYTHTHMSRFNYITWSQLECYPQESIGHRRHYKAVHDVKMSSVLRYVKGHWGHNMSRAVAFYRCLQTKLQI